MVLYGNIKLEMLRLLKFRLIKPSLAYTVPYYYFLVNFYGHGIGNVTSYKSVTQITNRIMNRVHPRINIHRESKKRDTILLSTVSPNIDRFSKLFHRQIQQETCNKEIIKDSTTPQTCRYTSL